MACASVILSTVAWAAEAAAYLGPKAVVASKDGKTPVRAQRRRQADRRGRRRPAGKVTRTIAVPAEPTGLALSPDGATLYVTCAAPQSTRVP